jgi:glycosyltransferase involved in cell wall biosynthesis
MRIAVDARIAQSDRVGIGVYVSGLVRALARGYPEHEIVLITSPNLPAVDVDTLPNVRTVPEAPTFQQYVARDWWEQCKLAGVLERLKADVYHSAHYSLPFVRRSPCPTVMTLYDASLFEIASAYRAGHAVRVRYLIARSIRNANALVFGSRHAQSAFVRQFGTALPAMQRAIYMGVPEDIATGNTGRDEEAIAAVKAEYGLLSPYAIAVGSINPRKNYVRLIEALNHPSLSECSLVLAGGVAWKSSGIMRAIDDCGMRHRVSLTGFVETSKLRALIQGAAMLVFPSLYEGFGIPPLEAFALGVPVCASSATSIPEVVGDAALLFDPYSVAEISDAISRLLVDEELRDTLIARGHERLTRFSWEKCAEAHMQMYLAVVADRHRGRA